MVRQEIRVGHIYYIHHYKDDLIGECRSTVSEILICPSHEKTLQLIHDDGKKKGSAGTLSVKID
jgi:hypothetical protein